MNAEQAIKKWAAAHTQGKYLPVDVDEITDVAFSGYSTGGGCETCDFGNETGIRVEVWFVRDGRPRSASFEVWGFSLADIMKQVIDGGS